MAYFRTGTNDFSAIQYENLESDNVSKGITVTVKDPNDNTLKSVSGNSPVLIGTYNASTTTSINVSSYLRPTDTVNNFIIEVASIYIGAGNTHPCEDTDNNQSGSSSLSKSLNGTTLTISGLYARTTNGNGWVQGTCWASSYRVYHI